MYSVLHVARFIVSFSLCLLFVFFCLFSFATNLFVIIIHWTESKNDLCFKRNAHTNTRTAAREYSKLSRTSIYLLCAVCWLMMLSPGFRVCRKHKQSCPSAQFQCLHIWNLYVRWEQQWCTTTAISECKSGWKTRWKWARTQHHFYNGKVTWNEIYIIYLSIDIWFECARWIIGFRWMNVRTHTFIFIEHFIKCLRPQRRTSLNETNNTTKKEALLTGRMHSL